MSRKYKFWDKDKLYFISFATVNWFDFFIRKEYFDAVINCWKYCQEHKGLRIYGWCIMTSHIHMIISTKDKPLEDIVRDIKSYLSSCFRKKLLASNQESRKEWIAWMCERAGKKNSNNIDWQFWQQHNKPIEINSEKQFNEILWYIHLNPVVSGFVSNPEHWFYRSASSYEKNNGIIKLED